tara:strand:- start:2597 stop:3418 length:822 start_codon:yes stop_codon:yes gene_type:complete
MENQKVDYLKEDPVISGQEVALISFVEPKNARLLQNKESFVACNFITHFLDSYKKTAIYQSEHQDEELTAELKSTLDLSYENIKSKYYSYQRFNLSTLEKAFGKEHNKNKEPTVTGFKVRGVYPSQLVTKSKADELQRFEPAINVFCIPVGKWIPYCPLNDQEVEAEYQTESLNNLVQSKDDEMKKRDVDYEQRKFRLQKKNAEENRLKKLKNEEEKNNDSESESDEVQVEEILDEIYQAPVETSSQKKSKQSKGSVQKSRKALNKRNINKKN